ncbi:MAG TPA: type II toxin-antitoxin system RelE/ParE family toxin [Candidatus Pullichristensenella excrementipullorum]|nr:type II toxin-antitoxin system RelE/ParE family toxin [Candidatus Pullichristensenella excrementipullorum]
MTYTVRYAKAALKSLQKLDRPIAAMLYAWVGKNLVGCTDPRAHGKALTANRSGLWRYRVGDYRLIAQIDDSAVTILMLEIGHRSSIYKQ